MANFTNIIVITDSQEMSECFKDVQKRYKNEDGGVLFIKHRFEINSAKQGRYMFEPHVSEDGMSMTYQTKWQHNIDDLVKLATMCNGAKFILISEEFGCDDNYYISFDGKKIVDNLHIETLKHGDFEPEDISIIDKETGEYFDGQSDYLDWLIENKFEVKIKTSDI